MNAPEWLLALIENIRTWRDGEPYQRPRLFWMSV